ncbi:Presequence translocated-associated motor subunit pam17 mitochondrial [Pyrenophora seminiperda CCB06]|uniref:Presequence translocated-associated motor subunit PAM17 n=1 Tax=Pyrenophora seminiperda CCB06 TaxID=1302712 RepID=A0A3M7MIJ6_9PLEO|nr:Presequence translocated-associated motor subunit pam17 mitochondrial [Pyrenophora seminiperda CCB06]
MKTPVDAAKAEKASKRALAAGYVATAMLSSSALFPARAFAKRFSPGILAPSSRVGTASLSTCVRTRRCGRSLSTMIHAARHASTSTSTIQTSSAPAANNSPSAQLQLTWNAFFALRRTRRRIGQACSGIGAVGVTYFGLTTMIKNGYDATLSTQLGGFDPLMLMGMSTLGMMALGWLVGPVFGNMVFNLAYRGVVGEFTRKDSAFFNRIKQHRVDPTASSLANPPPDYYGEKIGSVAGYRRWLKDQRAFNLKTGRYKATKASETNGL